MSRFAFQMGNTTRWYANDGKGNGYFAPGWDKERIARRVGVLRWIGIGLAVLTLGFPAIHLPTQYSEQFRYNHAKAEGVETTAVVDSVAVEHSTHRPRKASWKYITLTTAQVQYTVKGQPAEAQVTQSSSDTSNFTSQGEFPPPAWRKGQSVRGYVEPSKPSEFVLIDKNREADAGSMPRGAVLVLCFTGLFLMLPLVLIIAGTRNVKRAREL